MKIKSAAVSRQLGRALMGFVAGLAVALAAGLVSASTAHAASTTTVAPVADAWVDSGRPRANFGSSKALMVDGAPVARGYVRFRVSGLASPVVTATLRVFANGPSAAGFAVRSAGAKAWTERGLTYANAPSVSRAYASSGRIRRAGWKSLSVTPLVTGNGTVNLAITTARAAALGLASREAGARRPQLVVVSNGPPRATDVAATVDEDSPQAIQLSATDADGDAVRYAVVTTPRHGTLSPVAGNAVTYTPDANYNGPDSFTFRASDGGADSAPATVALTVRPVNDAPVCANVALTLAEDAPGSVAPACSDVDGDLLAYAVDSQGAKGTASVVAGWVHYEPHANANAADAFTYRASDGTQSSNGASVSVWIAPVNDAPQAASASATTDEDSPREIALSATDVDGDALAYAVATGASHGTLSPLSGNKLTYTPAANYNGPDSFTFRASDGVASSTAVVSLSVAPANDAPVCGARSKTTAEDTVVTGVACVDVDGDALAYSSRTGPTSGTLALQGEGTFTYTPAANYSGADSAGLTASDGNGGTDTGTLSLTVTAVNDPPVAVVDRRTLAEDAAVTLNAKGNDAVGPANEAGQTLAVTEVTDPAHGTAKILTAEDDPTRVNYVRYKPDPNYNGPDSFTYTVCDNGETNGLPDPTCATATVFATVTPVDDAPVCYEGAAAELTTEEATPVSGVACREVDGDAVAYTVTSTPSHGMLAFTAADASFTYTPGPGHNGSDSFQYQGCDTSTAAKLCDPGTARVTTVRFVAPTAETVPVPNAGDAADDPAIWVNTEDPERSAFVGTDKEGGIAVYDLAGNEIEYRADGRMNNVDLRAGFQLGGGSVTLVAAGNRSDNSIAVYTLDPETRTLAPVGARTITAGLEVYGSCMYRSSATGKLYYFVTSKEGYVEQWELFDNGSAAVDATRVRTFSVGSQTEGCVADDELGHLYMGEENVGIWKYSAEPDGGTSRLLVDSTGPSGHLVADVEGLSIAYGAGGTGHLIASSQGNDSYVVYRRDGANEFVRTVKVAAANGIDATDDTDGLDVTTANLGPAFPDGLLVVQDGVNGGVNGAENQNYKLVPLGSLLRDAP